MPHLLLITTTTAARLSLPLPPSLHPADTTMKRVGHARSPTSHHNTLRLNPRKTTQHHTTTHALRPHLRAKSVVRLSTRQRPWDAVHGHHRGPLPLQLLHEVPALRREEQTDERAALNERGLLGGRGLHLLLRYRKCCFQGGGGGLTGCRFHSVPGSYEKRDGRKGGRDPWSPNKAKSRRERPAVEYPTKGARDASVPCEATRVGLHARNEKFELDRRMCVRPSSVYAYKVQASKNLRHGLPKSMRSGAPSLYGIHEVAFLHLCSCCNFHVESCTPNSLIRRRRQQQ